MNQSHIHSLRIARNQWMQKMDYEVYLSGRISRKSLSEIDSCKKSSAFRVLLASNEWPHKDTPDLNSRSLYVIARKELEIHAFARVDPCSIEGRSSPDMAIATLGVRKVELANPEARTVFNETNFIREIRTYWKIMFGIADDEFIIKDHPSINENESDSNFCSATAIG